MGHQIDSLAEQVRSRPARLGRSRLVTIDGPAGAGKTTLTRRLADALAEVDHRPKASKPPIGTASEEVDVMGARADLSDQSLEVAGAKPTGTKSPQVAVIHMDDLYDGWNGLNADLFARLDAEILQPLSRDQPANYARYNWAEDRFDGTFVTDSTLFVIIEGVGANDAVTQRFKTLSIWLDIDPDTGRDRGMLRDSGIRETAGVDTADRPSLADDGSGSDTAHVLQWDGWMATQTRYFGATNNRQSADVTLNIH